MKTILKCIYIEKDGFLILPCDSISSGNGKIRRKSLLKPDYTSALLSDYRRSLAAPVLDVNTGRIITIANSLDTKNLKLIRKSILSGTHLEKDNSCERRGISHILLIEGRKTKGIVSLNKFI